MNESQLNGIGEAHAEGRILWFYFEFTFYHRLFMFNAQGDCLAARLRFGNVASAEGEELPLPEIERQ